jgi:hypothetical protein
MQGQFSRPLDLFDEKSFQLLMDYEVRRSQRYISPVSLIHLAPILRNPSPADEERALGTLAFLLATRLRATDTPARLSKNIFAVLLPNTNEAGMRTLSERLISITTGMHSEPGGQTTQIFICIGGASHPGGASLNAGTLMQQAEAALARSRKHGPQTYVVYSDTPTIKRSQTSSP